jgi:branched-subunit amino acid ABC-type transport system permease component
MEMLGLDVVGAGKKKVKPDSGHVTPWYKVYATYLGAGLGALAGVLVMAYTGKHAGSKWTGRALLPVLKKPVSAYVKNGVGAAIGGTALGVGAHYLKEKEGW